MKHQLILASFIMLIASSIVGNVQATSTSSQSSVSVAYHSNPKSVQHPKCKPLPQDAMVLDHAQILSIDKVNNTVIIVPPGKSNTIENQIRLIITPDTKITSAVNNKPLTMSDLQPCTNIRVVHSSAFTKSIPPQTVAYCITIL